MEPSGDYPELPGALIGELWMRKWLFPPDRREIESLKEKNERQWGRAVFWDYLAGWCYEQAKKRQYQPDDAIKEAADDDLQREVCNYLEDQLYSWRFSQGAIAFVVSSYWKLDIPPVENTLLPFRLVESLRHDPPADFGLKSAWAAMAGSDYREPGVFLDFPTLGKTLPNWMDGTSGGLPIWFGLETKKRELALQPLEIGLTGVMKPAGAGAALDRYGNPPEVIREKYFLFSAAKIPRLVLPDTLGPVQCHPSCTVEYWETNACLRGKMKSFMEKYEQRIPQINSLNRYFSFLVEGDEEVEFEPVDIRTDLLHRHKTDTEATRQKLELLLYICSCRLNLETERLEYERKLSNWPLEELKTLQYNLKFAGLISPEPAQQYLLEMSTKIREKRKK